MIKKKCLIILLLHFSWRIIQN